MIWSISASKLGTYLSPFCIPFPALVELCIGSPKNRKGNHDNMNEAGEIEQIGMQTCGSYILFKLKRELSYLWRTTQYPHAYMHICMCMCEPFFPPFCLKRVNFVLYYFISSLSYFYFPCFSKY